MGNIPNLVVSGICTDIKQANKIFQLLKIDVIVIISSKINFITSCKLLVAEKPALIICTCPAIDKITKTWQLNDEKGFHFHCFEERLEALNPKIQLLCDSATNDKPVFEQAYISKREKEILQLILRGKKNKEIADDLYLSIKTVENHRNNILKKTRSKSMIMLINDLYRVGFLN